ncbi:MAG: DUF805 domain-containing protein [Granulosicoccus sp.]
MTFSESIKHVLSNYAKFEGRAARSEFWWFALFSFLVQIVASILDATVGGVGIFGLLASLALLIPSLSVGARRLHDTNRSGWWLLISLVPLIGFLVLLVFFILRGTDESNRFGDPQVQSLKNNQLVP